MTTDDAFDRLRAADPAIGTEPDMSAITAAVAASTGVPLAGAGTERVHDEVAARRRRRTEWMRMAAAVAAVAVVTAGGYLASANGSAGGATGGGAPNALPAISLDGGASRDQAATGPAMSAEGTSGGKSNSTAPSASGGAGTDMSMPVHGGRIVFSGGALSAEGGSARAWAFDASSVSSDAAARLAAALGVTGTPRAEWGAWVVGPSDGSGPSVRLDGGGNLSYNDPGRDPWRCQASSGSGSGGSTGGVAVPPVAPNASSPAQAQPMPPDKAAPAPAPTPVNPSVCRTGSTPRGDAATSRARDALKAVGVDTSGTQVQVDDANGKGAEMGGADYVWVSFQQVIDGRLTGVGWGVTLVGDGVQSLSGTIAPMVSLGDYPVISPAAAVDRLNDPRFGTYGGAMPYYTPYAAADGSATVASGVATPGAVASADPSQQPTTPPAPTPGAPVSWPVQHVTLGSAVLGVALTYQANGSQLLVPAYVLTDSNGGTWSVIAVADDHLDFGTK